MSYSPGSKVVIGNETIIDLTSDTVEASKMLSGITAHDKTGAPVQGSIASKAAATYNTKASNQTIAAGQYLSGKQTIRGVTTANIDAENIKDGVVVKVGDSASAGRIKNVTGTFTDASTVSNGQTAAGAGQIREGYSAWVDGAEVQGNIQSLAGQTITPTRNQQTIQTSGKYLTGDIVIGGIPDTYYTAEEALEMLFPVGSIYMSTSSTAPSFGGTWQEIRITETWAQVEADTQGYEAGAGTGTVHYWRRTA